MGGLPDHLVDELAQTWRYELPVIYQRLAIHVLHEAKTNGSSVYPRAPGHGPIGALHHLDDNLNLFIV